jgi:hypothetical protein
MNCRSYLFPSSDFLSVAEKVREDSDWLFRARVPIHALTVVPNLLLQLCAASMKSWASSIK